MMSADSSERQHVFALDDDEGILRLERKALERAGFRVTAAANSADAMATILRDKPDLLVLDYSLGTNNSGLDFYRKLRFGGMDVPAILVTGFSDEGRAIEALRAGIRDVVPKVGGYLDYLPEAVTRVLEQVRSARMLAETQAASRAKDHFLAVLSHELRTPLTPVLSAVQMLESFGEFSPEARNVLALIRRNIELEARLIDDLLDITRITRGKLQLQQCPTDLHEKIANVLQTVQDDVRAKRLNLSLDLRATRTTVNADPTRLQQVLWNLLKNAVKFTPEGGSITVRTMDAAGGRVRLDVADTGIGISAEALKRIFNAFEQGSPAVTREFGGLGLGLNISKSLVEAHAGRISATSPGVGEGATFSVELPICTAAGDQRAGSLSSSAAACQSSPAGQTPVPRILLVEDHHDTSAMLARLLRRSGHHVTTADSVASALQVAGSEPFDVVVSDIGLPDGSGLDLMRQLLANHSIKGIALSGFGMEEDVARSRQAGFTEHLVKPVSFDQLMHSLRRVVAEPASN